MIIAKWRLVNVVVRRWEDLQGIIVFLLMEKLMKFMITVSYISGFTSGSFKIKNSVRLKKESVALPSILAGPILKTRRTLMTYWLLELQCLYILVGGRIQFTVQMAII